MVVEQTFSFRLFTSDACLDSDPGLSEREAHIQIRNGPLVAKGLVVMPMKVMTMMDFAIASLFGTE